MPSQRGHTLNTLMNIYETKLNTINNLDIKLQRSNEHLDNNEKQLKSVFKMKEMEYQNNRQQILNRQKGIITSIITYSDRLLAELDKKMGR